MSNVGVAKIFMHGRSQAVRLPLAFRLPGDRVRVRRVENGILLEPIVTDIDAWRTPPSLSALSAETGIAPRLFIRDSPDSRALEGIVSLLGR